MICRATRDESKKNKYSSDLMIRYYSNITGIMRVVVVTSSCHTHPLRSSEWSRDDLSRFSGEGEEEKKDTYLFSVFFFQFYRFCTRWVTVHRPARAVVFQRTVDTFTQRLCIFTIETTTKRRAEYFLCVKNLIFIQKRQYPPVYPSLNRNQTKSDFLCVWLRELYFFFSFLLKFQQDFSVMINCDKLNLQISLWYIYIIFRRRDECRWKIGFGSQQRKR